eukprot:g77707.t1
MVRLITLVGSGSKVRLVCFDGEWREIYSAYITCTRMARNLLTEWWAARIRCRLPQGGTGSGFSLIKLAQFTVRATLPTRNHFLGRDLVNRRVCQGKQGFGQTKTMAMLTTIAGASGAVAAGTMVGVVGAQAAANALVPAAMAYFGTIVAGVGTIHTAGGAAATLQWFTTLAVGTAAAPLGVTVGGATALLLLLI